MIVEHEAGIVTRKTKIVVFGHLVRCVMLAVTGEMRNPDSRSLDTCVDTYISVMVLGLRGWLGERAASRYDVAMLLYSRCLLCFHHRKLRIRNGRRRKC